MQELKYWEDTRVYSDSLEKFILELIECKYFIDQVIVIEAYDDATPKNCIIIVHKIN